MHSDRCVVMTLYARMQLLRQGLIHFRVFTNPYS